LYFNVLKSAEITIEHTKLNLSANQGQPFSYITSLYLQI